MKKIIALTLCILMLISAVFSVSAQNNSNGSNTKTEAQILDEMAEDWIWTCDQNAARCWDGMNIYTLGLLFDGTGITEDAIREFYLPLKEGRVEDITTEFSFDFLLSVEKFDLETIEGGLGANVDTYLATLGAEKYSEEWFLNVSAESEIKSRVKSGKITEDTDIWDAAGEYIAFLIGKASCEDAKTWFEEAQKATDLETKRSMMLIGASFATFGCEFTIEKTDAIVKAPYTTMTDEELMKKFAELGFDIAGKLLPELGIALDAIEATTEFAVSAAKVTGLVKNLNSIAAYLLDPSTIESDKNGFYNAVSNQYDRYTYEINDFEITLDEYNGYLRNEAEYKKVDLPNALYGFPLVAFEGTFADDLVITEITIPAGIRSRGYFGAVIKNCDKLKKVSYNAISCNDHDKGYFFSGCDAELEVTFGEGVEVIPEKFISSCGLTEITFPEGVKTIHGGALSSCSKLKTVTFPSSVELLGTGHNDFLTAPDVVYNCPNLETVYYNPICPDGSLFASVFRDCGNNVEEMKLIFGENITLIPKRFLNNCGVKEVIYPEGVTHIREYGIYNCNKLETITIPSTVVDFSENFAVDYVFAACNNLKRVNYNAINADSEVGTAVFNSIQSDFEVCFGEGVKSIPQNFVLNCGLTEITFPEGLETVRDSCLVNCGSLKTVTVPSTVTTMEYRFIQNAKSLETVYFNANLTFEQSFELIFDSGDFSDPKMQVILGPNVTVVPNNFIENCAIREFVYPEGVETIRAYSLVNCDSLERVVIPTTLKSIAYYAVKDCDSLKTIEYNAQNAAMSSVGYPAFYQSGTPEGLEILFGDSVETLPERLMNNCTIREVIFPDSLKAIPKDAIRNCDSLTRMVIPENVASIGDGAFYGNGGLKEIYFNAVNVADLNSINNTFTYAGQNTEGITFFVGSKVERIPGNLFSSSTANPAPKITSVQFAADGVCREIGKAAFKTAVNLPAIEFPASLKTIGANAFENCTILSGVTFNEGLDTIGERGFYMCSAIPSVTIPESLTFLGGDAFYGCTALAEVHYNAVNLADLTDVDGAFSKAGANGLQVTIGKNVERIPGRLFSTLSNPTLTKVAFEEGSVCESIGANAFYGCEGLSEIELPGSVTSIEDKAFTSCVGLTNVTLPEGLKTIGQNAFSECSGLVEIVIPNGVTSLGSNAFYGCTGLTNVTIGSGISTIPQSCFSGCKSLGTISLQNSVTNVATTAFNNTGLTKVIYCGTEEQWNAIKIYKSGNANLLAANRQYHAWVEDPDTQRRSCQFCGILNCEDWDHDWDEGVVTKEPTEETEGEKFYTCHRCSEAKMESIPKLDHVHTYTEVVTEPTYTAQGYTTHTCFCGESFVDSYVDPLPLPEAKIEVARMILGNELAMQFAFPKTSIVEGVEYVVSVTKAYADGREDKNILVPMDQWGTSGSYYYVSFNGIAAKEMGDTINVQIQTADGAAVGGVYTDSVWAYAIRQLRKTTDSKTRTLYVDMLNYGAAAQTYFKYDAANLVTDELTETEKGYGTQSVKLENNLVKGAGYVASQLDLGSSILLRVKFNGIDASMHAVVCFTNHMGDQKTITIPGSEFISGGTVVVIDDVVAADYDRDVTITVYDAGGTEVANAVESVASYLSRQLEKPNPLAIYDAVAKYCAAAYGYLHK